MSKKNQKNIIFLIVKLSNPDQMESTIQTIEQVQPQETIEQFVKRYLSPTLEKREFDAYVDAVFDSIIKKKQRLI